MFDDPIHALRMHTDILNMLLTAPPRIYLPLSSDTQRRLITLRTLVVKPRSQHFRSLVRMILQDFYTYPFHRCSHQLPQPKTSGV